MPTLVSLHAVKGIFFVKGWDSRTAGEARGPEALEILQAMNTGHDGSMSTIHANSSRGTLARLETMVLSASIDLPLDASEPRSDPPSTSCSTRSGGRTASAR